MHLRLAVVGTGQGRESVSRLLSVATVACYFFTSFSSIGTVFVSYRRPIVVITWICYRVRFTDCIHVDIVRKLCRKCNTEPMARRGFVFTKLSDFRRIFVV